MKKFYSPALFLCLGTLYVANSYYAFASSPLKANLLVTIEKDNNNDGTPDYLTIEHYLDDGLLIKKELDEEADGKIDSIATYKYDDKNRLTEEVLRNTSGKLLLLSNYEYTGNLIVNRTDTDNDSIWDGIYIQSFNDNNKLIKEEWDEDGDGSIDRYTVYEYKFDNAGQLYAMSVDEMGDGYIERMHHYSFNNDMELISEYVDKDFDGTLDKSVIQTWSNHLLQNIQIDNNFDGAVDLYTSRTYDDASRISLVEEDLNGNGLYDRVIRYKYDHANPIRPGHDHTKKEEIESQPSDKTPNKNALVVLHVKDENPLGMQRVNNLIYRFTAPLEGFADYSGGCYGKNRYFKKGENIVRFFKMKEGTYNECIIYIKNHKQEIIAVIKLAPFIIDIANIVKEVKSYGDINNVRGISVIYNNEYGDPIRKEYFRNNNLSAPSRVYYYRYEYDERGNWITYASDWDADGYLNHITYYTYNEYGLQRTQILYSNDISKNQFKTEPATIDTSYL